MDELIEPYPAREGRTIIPIDSKFCPLCGTDLVDTGWNKAMYPPLNIMNCDSCKRSWWRSTRG